MTKQEIDAIKNREDVDFGQLKCDRDTLINALINCLQKIEILERDNELLEALRQCGVDNWEGYSDAIELAKSW